MHHTGKTDICGALTEPVVLFRGGCGLPSISHHRVPTEAHKPDSFQRQVAELKHSLHARLWLCLWSVDLKLLCISLLVCLTHLFGEEIFHYTSVPEFHAVFICVGGDSYPCWVAQAYRWGLWGHTCLAWGQ